MKIDNINSNIVFIFSIIVSIIKDEWIYCILALCVLYASTIYHLSLAGLLQVKRAAILRWTDIFFASLSYLYLLHYIETRIYNHQLILELMLLSTLFVFAYGKYKKSETVHAIFHLGVGVTSLCILVLS